MEVGKRGLSWELSLPQGSLAQPLHSVSSTSHFPRNRKPNNQLLGNTPSHLSITPRKSTNRTRCSLEDWFILASPATCPLLPFCDALGALMTEVSCPLGDTSCRAAHGLVQGPYHVGYCSFAWGNGHIMWSFTAKLL